jgi:hypothetical protein
MDNLTKSIIEHIKVFLILGLKLMGDLFIKYILSFLILVIIIAIIILKLHWKRLHVIIFMVISFFVMIIGPLILFKIITHEPDLFIHLRSLSLSIAIQTIIILGVIFHRNLFK